MTGTLNTFEGKSALLARLHQHYIDKLPGSSAEEHLLERKFTPEVMARFGIGYAPEVWDFECSDEELEVLADEVGHIFTDQGVTDRFHGRLMFPIYDAQGRVRGFSGRALVDHPAKYKNSIESSLFHKGQLLFGFNLARESMYRQNEVILVEGFTDVLAFHQIGKTNVVGTMGVKLTDDHMAEICRYTNRARLCFDSDDGGSTATTRAISLCEKFKVSYGKMKLPEGKDPADVLLG